MKATRHPGSSGSGESDSRTLYRPGSRFMALAFHVLVVLVLMAFLTGGAISIWLNAEFGASRAGEPGRWVAVVCDLFKIGLSAALVAITDRYYRLAGMTGILAFALLSIFSSYGYYIKQIERNRGEHNGEQTRYRMLSSRRQDLLSKLKHYGSHRPVEVIEQDIRTRKQDVIYRDRHRSDRCRNATIPESRRFCETLRDLEVELVSASKAWPRIRATEASLQAIDRQLSGIDLARLSQRPDPFASSLGDVDRVNLVFNLYLAFLLEIATTTGLPLAIVLFRAANAISQTGAVRKMNRRKSAGKRRGSCADGLEQFLESCLARDGDSFVTASDLMAAYHRWSRINAITDPLKPRQISLRMSELGYTRTRQRVENGTRPVLYSGVRFKRQI